MLAKGAAAKDLIDKCYRVGLITEALHASIGNHPFLKKKDLPQEDYGLAVDALIDLDKKMSATSWPWDIYSAREMEQDVLDRLKSVFSAMNTNGSMSSGLIESRKNTDFCRRCKLYGHTERECRSDYPDDRPRGRSRSPALPREPRAERHYERGRRSDRYDYSDVRSGPSHYTPDEIAQKIAQQREELLRREMMIRSPEAIDDELLPQPAYLPQPLIPLGGGPATLAQSATQLVDPLLIQHQLRAREEDEYRAKREAEARRMEEEQRLKEKERELERRMQRELEEKKRALEEEIRKQVQMEERAKLQMELAQRHTQQQPLHGVDPSYPSFSSQHSNSSFMLPSLSSFAASSYANELSTGSYSSAPDFEMEEIKRLVKETEDKLLDLQRNAREAELSAIFQSRAFQTVAELGDNAYLLDRSQKQHLLCELKELLSHAGPRERERKARSRHRSHSRGRSRRESSRHHRERTPHRRSRSPRHHGSYRRSKEREVYKEVRHQVGGITLRNLSPTEQRRLKVGDIVVAQDVKTGKWTTAHIAKISSDRATLTIGNATWKKNLDELFKEVPEWSA
ncbi:hypothetical protein ANCDUO_04895 [Ancylostoma duodenale]|uniref:Uncharacterized protein n=1 Tax=Ancylostoma duodenale TaxID=51022 RepID=A0A0C2GZY4_9BILA|nr:hypothetical protein ANCDUO_04895 [Ancylostoma duodenale]